MSASWDRSALIVLMNSILSFKIDLRPYIYEVMQDPQQDEENDHHISQEEKEQHINGATNRRCRVIRQAYADTNAM